MMNEKPKEKPLLNFMGARTAKEYLNDVRAEVTPIAGTPDVGIMWAEQQPLFISGDTGAGKTFSMLSLLKCRLEGGFWLGRFPVKPITSKAALINLDRDGNMTRAKAMGLDHDRLVILDYGDLAGVNFITEPDFLLQINRDTGCTDFFVDGMSQLITDPTSTEQGSKFAIAVKEATQHKLNICGTFQNKRPKEGLPDPDGRGAWLGSAHILGTCGVGITLKPDSKKDSSTRFKQVKSCDGRPYIKGNLAANHENHTLVFAGGSVLNALQALGSPSRAEIKAFTGISSDDTVKSHLAKYPGSWIEIQPDMPKDPVTGGTNPVRYKLIEPNSDHNQDFEGTILSPITIPKSVELNPLLVKEMT